MSKPPSPSLLRKRREKINHLAIALQEARDNGNSVEVNRLFIDLRKAVGGLIAKAIGGYRDRFELDELNQVASTALWQALHYWKPDNGRATNWFSSYAYFIIRGELWNYCLANEAPQHAATNIRRAANTYRRVVSYAKQLGKSELAERYEHPQEAELTEAQLYELRTLKDRFLGYATGFRFQDEEAYSKAVADAQSYLTSIGHRESALMLGSVYTLDVDPILEKHVMGIVAGLEEIDKVVYLCFCQELSYSETADILRDMGIKDITRQAVGARLRSIKKQIRRLTDDY